MSTTSLMYLTCSGVWAVLAPKTSLRRLLVRFTGRAYMVRRNLAFPRVRPFALPRSHRLGLPGPAPRQVLHNTSSTLFFPLAASMAIGPAESGNGDLAQREVVARVAVWPLPRPTTPIGPGLSLLYSPSFR